MDGLMTGKDLYDYIDDRFDRCEGNFPDFDFNWDDKQPETMRAICPKLVDHFWT